MDRARDTGEPAISERVILLQETTEGIQQGFLMYLPVYRRGMPTETTEQRRAALRGFVYSPFRMGDLMHGILGVDQADIDFEIYDGDKPSPDRLLYSNAGTTRRGDSPPRPDFEGLFDILIRMCRGEQEQVILFWLDQTTSFDQPFPKFREGACLYYRLNTAIIKGHALWLTTRTVPPPATP